jgi:thioesterase DpgC
VDLVLLHPEIRMGVLRGATVEHLRYKGRRVFDAGINLTKIYHGKVSFMFYLNRDAGMYNKIFRGMAIPGAWRRPRKRWRSLGWRRSIP